jgi:hypothetical protein
MGPATGVASEFIASITKSTKLSTPLNLFLLFSNVLLFRIFPQMASGVLNQDL